MNTVQTIRTYIPRVEGVANDENQALKITRILFDLAKDIELVSYEKGKQDTINLYDGRLQ